MLKEIILITLINITSMHLLFELQVNKPICYLEELYTDTEMLIKWKIFTKTNKDISKILNNVIIYITSEETKQQVFSYVPTSPKAKTIFYSSQMGNYRVCVIYRTSRSAVEETLFMNIRFIGTNHIDPNIQQAIQNEDVAIIKKRVNDIKEIGVVYIEKQKNDLEMENVKANITIKNTRWYKYVTFAQIGICIVIGVLQIANFKKYLKYMNVI